MLRKVRGWSILLVGLVALSGWLLLSLLRPGDANTASAQQRIQLRADLSGPAEVPPVTTRASGLFTGELDTGRGELSFTIRVSNISGVTQAHPHCGLPTVAGPVFAWFFGAGMTPGSVLPAPPPTAPLAPPGVNIADGVLSSGVIREANLIRTILPCGASFAAFVENVLAGNVYVNVHTVANPPGEVRGQLRVVTAAAPPAGGVGPQAGGDGGVASGWYAAAAAGAALLAASSLFILRGVRSRR